MSNSADYRDYIHYLRDSMVALRELAAREKSPSNELVEIAERLGGLADELSAAESAS